MVVALSFAPFLLAPPSVEAGAGKLDNDGTMDFEFNFRFPPTPEQIEDAKDAIRRANEVICDAADGQVRFENVRLTGGAVDEDRADIWFFADPGRSGVSFYFDGSNLGRLGRRIGLFRSGLTGDVVAHELGHHAFGLGDEYDEQCRWGGNCGIGPCFDGGVNEGSHCIMQQTGIVQCIAAGTPCLRDGDCPAGDSCAPVLMSEMCVNQNHDLQLGDNAACGMPACAAGACTDADCNQRWNTTTNRFEVTQQELIHPGLSCWETVVQNYPFLTAPAALPAQARPAVCATAVNFVEDVEGTDQVMLFIDRSGSMSAKVNPDSMQSRLDFAKAAARVFVDLQVDRAITIGLVSFNEAPTLDLAFQELTTANAAAVKATIDSLTAGGYTGIGDALLASIFPFQSVFEEGRTRTGFLLSDGQNNSGADPLVAAGTLQSSVGVRIFTIPVGDTADAETLSEMAGESAGTMLDAPAGDELPAIYGELAARFRGEALTLPRTESEVAQEIIIASRQGSPLLRGLVAQLIESTRWFWGRPSAYAQANGVPPSEEFEFLVEDGAQQLNVLLSARNGNVNTWDPDFVLSGPGGEVITNGDQEVTADPFYRLIKVIGPTPGMWMLEVIAPSTILQRSFVQAHVENPLPDCLVDAFPRLADPSGVVSIAASATFGPDLEGAVSFEGTVRRPDGSLVPLSFVRDDVGRTDTADFSAFAGRGVYDVTVDCRVLDGARTQPGEVIFEGPDVDIDVPPFVRTARTSFFLDTPDLPPCPGPDGDMDGIPNEVEGTDDVDNDGLPCECDDDCDGDDVPDQQEGIDDTDGDGDPDFRDVDSDNDGRPDGLDPNPKVADPAVCGDGFLSPGEDCDDGNVASGDCCSAQCRAEDLGTETCGIGACERTVPVCVDAVRQTCVPGAPGIEGPFDSPSCSDDVDNDCDGATDGDDLDCNSPPDCSGALPTVASLWPPQHHFESVGIDGVVDPDGDEVSISIDAVMQDEALYAPGSGKTCPDAKDLGGPAVMLRAERSGTRRTPGDGRVYHVRFTASDGKGGECSETVTVCVPHDQRRNRNCVDQGPLVNSIGPCS